MPLTKIKSLGITDGTVLAADIADGSVTAAKLAAGISGNGPAFSARRSTDQNISSSTWTKIQFNTENFDTASCYDNATNYRFTPNVAGYYQFNLNSSLAASGLSFVALAIFKNGSEAFLSSHFAGTGAIYNGCSTLLSMNGSTDYVEGYGYIVGTSPKFGDHPSTIFNGFLARIS
jgi:hypothetical protein